MNRRNALLGAAAVVGAAGLAALGARLLLTGDDDASEDAGPSPSDSGEATGQDNSDAATGDPTPHAPVTLTWWYQETSGAEGAVYDQWAADFEKSHPWVTIEPSVVAGADYEARLRTALAGGQAPDVFLAWRGLLAQDAADGVLTDLTEAAAPVADGFLPPLLDLFRFEDSLYGIPTQSSVIGFWYNRRLFDEAGVAPPATWAQFLDVVRTLRGADITPLSLAGADSWACSYYWTYLAMRVAGLSALETALDSGDFSAPEFVRTGQLLRDLGELGAFAPNFDSASYLDQQAVVGMGGAAMELTGQWAPGIYETLADTNPDDVGFFPFPTVNGGAGEAGDALGYCEGFAVGDDAPPEAADFAIFLAERAQQAALLREGAKLPALRDAVDEVPEGPLREPAETVSQATGFQLNWDQLTGYELNDRIGQATVQLLLGDTTPSRAAADIGEAASDVA